jgi:hypothetical protein
MADSKAIQSKGRPGAKEIAAAERRDLSSRLIEASRRAQGFREAYEALIEPLTNATIKLAEAETEHFTQHAQITAIETRLSETTQRLHDTEARLADTITVLSAQEVERELLSQELRAVYASHSWRVTEPLRRAITAMRQLRLSASAISARGREDFRAAANHASKFVSKIHDHTADGLRRLTSRRRHNGDRLLGWLTRLAGWWRLSWTRPRTVWGVTPILTLPLLARCDRLLGLRSESLVFTVYHTTNSFDINLKSLCDTVYRKFPGWIAGFHKTILQIALIRYDVVHTFCDRGLLPAPQGLQLDVDEMKAIRRHDRRLYTYTYGADVRTREATLALGRYNVCAECPEPGRFCTCDDERGAANIEAIRQYATAMVSMGDMLAYAPNARNLHYWPIETAKVANTSICWTKDRPLRVGHAPNHAHFKGTRYLVSAIELLRARGHAIELVSVSGVPNSEVLALFASCDVVADQFIAGFHGYTALEAMALGKPVLCYLRNRQAVIDPENCPIINCSPDSVEDVLAGLLDGRFDLADLGRRSRSYIEHYYSLEAVAIRLGRLYLETAAFPDRINRMISRRVAGLEARLPPLMPGVPPVAWDVVAPTDDDRQRLAEAAAR